MRVDEQTLIRTAHLEKHTAALGRTLPDGLELVVTTAGNLVLDLIVKDGCDEVLLDARARCRGLRQPGGGRPRGRERLPARRCIDLIKCMGVVFNPKFYLSLGRLHLEYASDALAGLGDLF